MIINTNKANAVYERGGVIVMKMKKLRGFV